MENLKNNPKNDPNLQVLLDRVTDLGTKYYLSTDEEYRENVINKHLHEAQEQLNAYREQNP